MDSAKVSFGWYWQNWILGGKGLLNLEVQIAERKASNCHSFCTENCWDFIFSHRAALAQWKMVSLLLCRSVWIIWKQFRLVSTILFAIMSWLAGKITIYSWIKGPSAIGFSSKPCLISKGYFSCPGEAERTHQLRSKSPSELRGIIAKFKLSLLFCGV